MGRLVVVDSRSCYCHVLVTGVWLCVAERTATGFRACGEVSAWSARRNTPTLRSALTIPRSTVLTYPRVRPYAAPAGT